MEKKEKFYGKEIGSKLGRAYVFLLLIVFLALGVALKFSPLTVWKKMGTMINCYCTRRYNFVNRELL